MIRMALYSPNLILQMSS